MNIYWHTSTKGPAKIQGVKYQQKMPRWKCF